MAVMQILKTEKNKWKYFVKPVKALNMNVEIQVEMRKVLRMEFCLSLQIDMGKEPMAPFDPYADPDKTAMLWKAWKRNFELYLDSKDILADRRKLAKLLFCAGQEVQRIYEQAKAKQGEESDSWMRSAG